MAKNESSIMAGLSFGSSAPAVQKPAVEEKPVEPVKTETPAKPAAKPAVRKTVRKLRRGGSVERTMAEGSHRRRGAVRRAVCKVNVCCLIVNVLRG